MGLYNFRPQFVDYVMEGSKTHTIRAERKYPDGPGDTMHLYRGLRQKGAQLLFRAPCVRVDFIVIDTVMRSTSCRMTKCYRVRIGASVGFDKFPALYGEGQLHGGFVELDDSERNQLAWRDGFRLTAPEMVGRKLDKSNPRAGCFDKMMRFWEGRLPFEGQIYHWDYSRRIK